MSAAEIILIVIGVAIFLLGYLMPARKKDLDEEVRLISEDEIRKMITGEMEHVKGNISNIVDETVDYSIEKAERAMERVTNEKVMAVSEYSDTVLEEINKNHKEVVFLYDMLNDKHDNLMSTINEATMAADSVKETTRDSEIMAHEAAEKIEAVFQASDDAADSIRDAMNAAAKVQKAAQESMRIVIRAVEGAKSELAALRAAKTEYMAEAQKMQPEETGRVQEKTVIEPEAGQIRKQKAEPAAEAGYPQAEPESTENADYGFGMELSETEPGHPQRTGLEAEMRRPQRTGLEAEMGRPQRVEPEAGSLQRAEPTAETGYLRRAEPRAEAVRSWRADSEAGTDRLQEQPEAWSSYSRETPGDGFVSDRIGQMDAVRSAAMPETERERFQRTMPEAPDDTPDFPEETETVEEEVDFTPISPRRVEIIHQPDGDYVAEDIDDMSTSEAFASMGFFAPREEAKRKPRARKAPRRERPQDAAPAVDLQFAQGKDNGRNSNERILELHKAGKSNMAIARELGLGLGEVKLVIDLFEGM